MVLAMRVGRWVGGGWVGGLVGGWHLSTDIILK